MAETVRQGTWHDDEQHQRSATDLSAPATEAGRQALFHAVFRRHAAGVAIVTAPGVHPVGLTATSLTSLSMTPPIICFGVATESSSWPALSQAEHTGIHLLDKRQQDLAVAFARSGFDRFAAASWEPGPYGVPLLTAALARLVARVTYRIQVGDHHLVCAEVWAGDVHDAGEPLVYQDRQYRALVSLTHDAVTRLRDPSSPFPNSL